MDSLFAVRQGPCTPAWLNPRTIESPLPLQAQSAAAKKAIASSLASDIDRAFPVTRAVVERAFAGSGRSYDNAAIFDSIHCFARSFTSRGSAPAGSIGGPMTTRMVPDFLNNPRRGQ